MALDAFLNEQGFTLKRSDSEIRLEKTRKINVTSIVVGAIFIAIFMLVGSWLKDSAILMYVVSLIIFIVVLRFNYRGARPITIFDWTHKNMIKKSVWFFVNSKSREINGYAGIDLKTVDLSSQSSEGVDEFQKVIYLKTSDGEITVIDFYTEGEKMEPELQELMNIIHDFLSVKS